ncbi:MAG: hypothetical protein JF616_19720 [Fibrobacteres bacterium]|nr:hypothetical protein [Fibrobacterota bacterium]
MPLLRTGILLLAPTLFLACGSARMASQEPRREASGLDSCKSRVVHNALVPGVKPANVIRNPRYSAMACYTASGMEGFAKHVACDSGYALANLINIREPGFWSGACYQADLEFYRSDSGVQVSESPIRKFDSIPAEGFQAVGILDVGGMAGGPQAHSGLVNDKGDKAKTDEVGFGLSLRYYFLPYLGMEAETAGRFGSANAPDTKSLSFTRAWTSRLGVSVILWQMLTLSGRIQAAVDGGLNYTRLAFAQDFKDFVETHAPVKMSDDAATGTGWYAGAQFRTITRVGFVGEFGGRYEASYPKFPGAKASYSGQSLMFTLGAGYLF